MMTPVDALLSVAAIGGQLGIIGDELRMLLPADCSPELKAAIRANKPGLMQLLRLNFLVVRSDGLGTTLLWVPDEATKTALVAAGADPGIIYTAGELDRLVGGRVSVRELSMIHAAKKKFAGRIMPNSP
jgi:hypothetical protein